MSQWTHITGAVRMECGVTVLKPNAKNKERPEYQKDWIVPYPDEQIHFEKSTVHKRNGEPTILMGITVASLPIAKRIIEKYVCDLPSGEYNRVPYWLNQDINDCRSSSSDFSSLQLKKLWEKEIMKRHCEYEEYYTYKEFSKRTKNELSWEHHCSEFTFTLCADLRYCDGDELLVKLLKFFAKLKKEGITINDGSLTWYDEWKEHHYQVRFGANFYENYDEIWEITDNKTGEILASHNVAVKWDKEDKGTYEEVTDSENWNKYANWKDTEENE